jgi:hypothetical protein
VEKPQLGFTEASQSKPAPGQENPEGIAAVAVEKIPRIL